MGPLIFKTKDAPKYAPGFIVVVITSIAAALLAIVYRFVCVWENKKRDKAGVEAYDHAYEDDLTDIKVSTNVDFEKTRRLMHMAEPSIQVSTVACTKKAVSTHADQYLVQSR